MKRVYLLVFLMFACTNEEASMKALLDSGYTQVELTGRAWTGCGEDDGSCVGFNALGPTGRYVEGVVGCSTTGCGKGCTVRLK